MGFSGENKQIRVEFGGLGGSYWDPLFGVCNEVVTGGADLLFFNSVLPHFVVEGFVVNAEDFGGLGAVPIGLFQSGYNRFFLHFFNHIF